MGQHGHIVSNDWVHLCGSSHLLQLEYAQVPHTKRQAYSSGEAIFSPVHNPRHARARLVQLRRQPPSMDTIEEEADN